MTAVAPARNKTIYKRSRFRYIASRGFSSLAGATGESMGSHCSQLPTAEARGLVSRLGRVPRPGVLDANKRPIDCGPAQRLTAGAIRTPCGVFDVPW